MCARLRGPEGVLGFPEAKELPEAVTPRPEGTKSPVQAGAVEKSHQKGAGVMAGHMADTKQGRTGEENPTLSSFQPHQQPSGKGAQVMQPLRSTLTYRKGRKER